MATEDISNSGLTTTPRPSELTDEQLQDLGLQKVKEPENETVSPSEDLKSEIEGVQRYISSQIEIIKTHSNSSVDIRIAGMLPRDAEKVFLSHRKKLSVIARNDFLNYIHLEVGDTLYITRFTYDGNGVPFPYYE